MLPDYIDFLIKRFENPDEVRTFEKGRFELIKIGGMTIGRATYEPGLEMVAACRTSCGDVPLSGGAHWHGDLGASCMRHAGWKVLRDEAWGRLLHRSRAR
jgi:hypothetical protein